MLLFVSTLSLTFGLAFAPISLVLLGLLLAAGWVLRRLQAITQKYRTSNKCTAQLHLMLAPFGMNIEFGLGRMLSDALNGSASGLTSALVCSLLAFAAGPMVFGGTGLAFQAYSGAGAAQDGALLGLGYTNTFALFGDARWAWPAFSLDFDHLDIVKLTEMLPKIPEHHLFDANDFVEIK